MTQSQAFELLSALLQQARQQPIPTPIAIAGCIRQIALDYGVLPDYMLRKAWIESRYNPLAVNAASRAAGLYQIMWFNCVHEWKTNPHFNPFIAEHNITWTCQFTRSNMQQLQRNGHAVTMGSLYLAHQQGASGATQILRAARNGLRIIDLPETLQRNIAANIPSSLRGRITTCAQFAELWEQKMQSARIPDTVLAFNDEISSDNVLPMDDEDDSNSNFITGLV